jgi:hypothetical protein
MSAVVGAVASGVATRVGTFGSHQQRAAVASRLGLPQQQQQQQQQQQCGLHRGRPLHHRRVVVTPQRTFRTATTAATTADSAAASSSTLRPTISTEFACPRLTDSFALEAEPSPFAEGGVGLCTLESS